MTRKTPIFDEFDRWADYDPSAGDFVRRTPKRVRKPTLASVAKQAAKADIKVAGYEIDANGKITVIVGTSGTHGVTNAGTVNADEWK